MKWLYLLLCFPLLCAAVPLAGPGDGRLEGKDIDRDKVFLFIDKTNYRLYLYEDTKLIKAYKVVFGNNDLGDKRMQGDKETPEGTFHIVSLRHDKRWHLFFLLDYPNAASLEKFNARKSKGRIPRHAKIGGGIGIHGSRPGVQQGIDLRINWTNGCIGMKNADIDELSRVIQVGTPVVIRR